MNSIDVDKTLEHYRNSLLEHLYYASKFLTECQAVEPWIEKGLVYGSVAPWKLGLWMGLYEDFHDTLEAIWTWSIYTYISRDSIFYRNIEKALEYIEKNSHRYLVKENPGYQYDAAHILHTQCALKFIGTELSKEIVEKAIELLRTYLDNIDSLAKRAYFDPFWIIACLAQYAKTFNRFDLLEYTEKFLLKALSILGDEYFTSIALEPKETSLGSHDFFSSNANRLLALYQVFKDRNIEELHRSILVKFKKVIPQGFVERHVDENAWNAHLATALAIAYRVTNDINFLRVYHDIMSKLYNRSKQYAIKRDERFPMYESWATYFYVQAHTALVLGIF